MGVTTDFPYTAASSFPHGPKVKVGGHDGTPLMGDPPLYRTLPHTHRLNYINLDNSEAVRSYHDGHPENNRHKGMWYPDDPAQNNPGIPRYFHDAVNGTKESHTKVRVGGKAAHRRGAPTTEARNEIPEGHSFFSALMDKSDIVDHWAGAMEIPDMRARYHPNMPLPTF